MTSKNCPWETETWLLGGRTLACVSHLAGEGAMLAPHAHMSWSQPKCFPHSFVFPTILGNFYNLVKDEEVRIGRRSLAD